jgi:hypothetical protein
MLGPYFWKETGMIPSHIFTLLLLLAAAPPGLAQDKATDLPPLSEAERQAIRVQSDALRQQSKDKRAAADKRLPTDKAACYKRFLVNSCLEAADARHLEASQEAKKMEMESNRMDRELKAREHAEEAAKAPSAAQQESDALQQRKAHEASLQSFEGKAPERAARKAEGAAQDAAQKQKMAQHAAARKQQAERDAQARQRVEESRKQTTGYQSAQEQAKKRAAEAEAQAPKPKP